MLIQTDKAIYKPGDNVQFRILVLDAEMLPYQYEKLSVAFTDGSKQKVTERIYYFSNNSIGFIEDSLQLSNELTFGKWGIHVLAEGKLTRQNFEVLDYQLPQFEVFVEPNKRNFLLSDNRITVKVYAKYTFGSGQKTVAGKIAVVATTYDPKDLTKPLTVSTKPASNFNTFGFEFQRDLRINGYLNQTIVQLEATFEDQLTKRTASAKSFVTIHKTEIFSFEFLAEKEFLTPGQPYKVKALIKDFDGSMVKGNKQVLFRILVQSPNKKCLADNSRNNLKITEQSSKEVKMNNGIAELVVQVPENAETLAIGVQYKGSYQVHKVFRMPTKSMENLELTMLKKRFDK